MGVLNVKYGIQECIILNGNVEVYNKNKNLIIKNANYRVSTIVLIV